jgi:hypothetical protein
MGIKLSLRSSQQMKLVYFKREVRGWRSIVFGLV